MRGLFNSVSKNLQRIDETMPIRDGRFHWRKEATETKLAKPERANRFVWSEEDHVRHVMHEDVTGPMSPWPNPNHVEFPKTSDLDEHESSMARHAESFTENHVKSLLDYKDECQYHNHWLRYKELHEDDDKDHDDNDTMCGHLDHITRHRFEKPLTVYRGFGTRTAIRMIGKPNGHEFTDDAFVSTSVDPNVASKFSGQHILPHSKEPHRIFAAIHMPAGSRGYHLDRHENDVVHEKEVLLARRSRFRITGHSKTINADGEHCHVVHMEHVPHP